MKIASQTTPGQALPAFRPAVHRSPVAAGYAIALLVFLADAATKYWVHESRPYGWHWPVTDFFNLVHVWNRGAAFSFLADAGGWQRYFFIVVALVASLWLMTLLRKPLRFSERLAYSLILGGAAGNGVDRGMRGYVVDFLDFYWRNWHWPAFNIADIGIVCGALLLVFSSLTTTLPHAPKISSH